jgi:hypothetical protein
MRLVRCGILAHASSFGPLDGQNYCQGVESLLDVVGYRVAGYGSASAVVATFPAALLAVQLFLVLASPLPEVWALVNGLGRAAAGYRQRGDHHSRAQ